jgi:hypothetical protein
MRCRRNADWIEALLHEGIPGGCGALVFTPLDPVLRQQMDVFVSRTFLLA